MRLTIINDKFVISREDEKIIWKTASLSGCDNKCLLRGLQKVTGFSKWLFGLLAMCVLLFSWQVSGQTTAEPEKKAEQGSVGELMKHTRGKKCLACHKGMEGGSATAVAHAECESCHVDSGSDIQASLKAGAAIKMPTNSDCTSCHKNDRKLMNWAFSAHNKAGSSCSDCHQIHGSSVSKGVRLSADKSDRNSAMCVKCHQDTGAEFKMRSHHPVQEGGMSCTGCHDPHGGGHTTLKSKTGQCLECHQAIGGPKVFEHAPVVEDCTNCHAPHGSANRGLLSTSQPSVCLQCHSIATSKHGFGSDPTPSPKANSRIVSGSVLRGCTNCHGAVHGSQQDPLLRY